MHILIVGGAGLMSAGITRDLLSQLSSGITAITAADSNGDRLAELKQSLPDPRLRTRVFDVSDRNALLTLLADCDLCINGVPTFAGFQMTIFDACLPAKRAYVDYGGMGVYTVQQKAQHEVWKNAGATAVIGLDLIRDCQTSFVALLPTASIAWTASIFIGPPPRLEMKVRCWFHPIVCPQFLRSMRIPASSSSMDGYKRFLPRAEQRRSPCLNPGDAPPLSILSIRSRLPCRSRRG